MENLSLLISEALEKGEAWSSNGKLSVEYISSRLRITKYYGEYRQHTASLTLNNVAETTIAQIKAKVRDELKLTEQ